MKINFLVNQKYQNCIISSEIWYNKNWYYELLFITKLYNTETL